MTTIESKHSAHGSPAPFEGRLEVGGSRSDCTRSASLVEVSEATETLKANDRDLKRATDGGNDRLGCSIDTSNDYNSLTKCQPRW